MRIKLFIILFFIPFILFAQLNHIPGSLKKLRESDAVNDADGKGQLFECIHVPNITDFVQGTNGFALADIDGNGFLDLVTITTPPFNLDGWPDRDSICGNEFDFEILPDSLARDKIRILLNQGDWIYEKQEIELTGSDATPDDFSQGYRGGQIPALADFNNDGFYDIFVTRQPEMMSLGKIPPDEEPVGCSMFIANNSINKYIDVSKKMKILNELAYNRQVSIADINQDGRLDIAIGADNVAAAFEGLPKSSLFVYNPAGDNFLDGVYEDISNTSIIRDFGEFHLDPAKDKAGPNIVLRDADNDGDIDLFQSCHTLAAEAPSYHPYSPAEYRQGVWSWKNQLNQTGKFLLSKDSLNGIAQEARMKYDKNEKLLVRMNPQDSAIGLAYLVFGDVNNDGLLDALAFDCSDRDRFPHPRDIGAVFWYNKGDFKWEESTKLAGLNSLNDSYLKWYDFFDETITAALYYKPKPVLSQPGLEPERFANRRPYHADASFADFNNDGWLDLIVLDRRQMDNVVSNRTKLYMNNGDGTFKVEDTEFSGIDDSGISCETADFNNDGLIDIFISGDPDNSGMPCFAQEFEDKIYMNTGLHGAKQNHWFRIKFSGITHAELIGSRVEIYDTSNTKLLGMRGIYTNQTYKSSSPLEAHFGLGKNQKFNLKVFLPDGRIFEKTDLESDKFFNFNIETNKLNEVGTISNFKDNIYNNRFDIYPNPASDYIEITIDEARLEGGLHLNPIEIYDLLGKKIMSVETRHALSLQRIDISHLPRGVYFVKYGNYFEKLVVVR